MSPRFANAFKYTEYILFHNEISVILKISYILKLNFSHVLSVIHIYTFVLVISLSFKLY
jgi:hypothetical protein